MPSSGFLFQRLFRHVSAWSTTSRTHYFVNIFAKTKTFAKTFLTVHLGLFYKKVLKISWHCLFEDLDLSGNNVVLRKKTKFVDCLVSAAVCNYIVYYWFLLYSWKVISLYVYSHNCQGPAEEDAGEESCRAGQPTRQQVEKSAQVLTDLYTVLHNNLQKWHNSSNSKVLYSVYTLH